MQISHTIGAYGKSAVLQAHGAVSTSCAWYEVSGGIFAGRQLPGDQIPPALSVRTQSRKAGWPAITGRATIAGTS